MAEPEEAELAKRLEAVEALAASNKDAIEKLVRETEKMSSLAQKLARLWGVKN